MDDPLDLSFSETQSGRAPRRRARRQLSSMQIVFAAILAIGLLLVINFSGRIARGQQMEIQRQRLQATNDVLKAKQIELRKARNYAAHDASVEHWAHTEGKMVREGEILVIPIPGRPIIATFGDLLELREFTAPETATTGTTLNIKLTWTAQHDTSSNFGVSVLLMDEGGQTLTQYDGSLDSSSQPLTWDAGELRNSTYRIALPWELTAGRYELGLKVYDSNNQSLRATLAGDEDSTRLYVTLGTIQIISATPEQDEEEKPAWYLWWRLFFDDTPPF